MGLFRRSSSSDDAGDREARSPRLGLKDKDLAVMGQLMDHGADLDEPRHVLHFCYFPDEASASAAGDELSGHGWSSEVAEPLPDYPGQWCLTSEQHDAVLSAAFVRESTDLFDAVAARHGGDHDGWEASA